MHTQLDTLMTRKKPVRRGSTRSQLLLLLFASLAVGCGEYDGGSPTAAVPGGLGSGGSGGTGSAGSGGSTQAESIQAFSQSVLPMLQANCTECHSGAGPGSPSIAHADATTAFFAVVNNQKVNLGNPPASRLAQRLAVDQHYCWTSCSQDGGDMAAMVAQWATTIGFDSNNTILSSAIRSGEAQLLSGVQIDPALARYTDRAIALYQFDEGTGATVAQDTSGVAPPLDLALEGAEFLSNYGLLFENGRAIGSRNDSRKLFDRIADPLTGSQQYTVEAWVTPANVTQEGPARIVTYSSSGGSRNFMLGQVLYTYVFRNRSMAAGVDNNGNPSLTTYDVDRDLQATLQHVVMTYDQYRGRRIYVDSVWTDDPDPMTAGRMFNWDPTDQLILGNERSNDRQFEGRIHYLAIFDQALTDESIRQNFLAGVGLKVVVRFDTGAWIPGSYIEFVVSELDNASYLFCEPTFVGGSTNGTRVAGIRVAVNGIVPIGGQAFSNVDSGVFGLPQRLSRQCAVIRKDLGPTQDMFSIDFEILEGLQFTETITYPPPPPDTSIAPPSPDHGFRDFALINATMAELTGVPTTTSNVQSTYNGISTQLPATVDMRSFVTSNQVGITKLALEYCDAMVEDPVLRDQFFGANPPFAFDQPTSVSFASQTERDQVISALYDRMVGVSLGVQPDYVDIGAVEGVHTTLDTVITNLIASCDAQTPCDDVRTRTIVKALCTGVLASAPVHLH